MKITSDFIAKIEGHGSLDIDWSENSVKLNIHEGERLFEGILVGRTAEESHWITPRICGVCPIAHNLASLRAVENAYGIKVNETTKLLRQLMATAQMIQSHSLHLFFLVLPDYVGLDRGTDLAEKDPKAFARALELKSVADDIATVVAGRNVHPTRTAVGGFSKVPTVEELEELRGKLKDARDSANWAVELFSGFEYPDIEVEFDLVAQVGGNIVSAVDGESSLLDYKKNVEEELRDYSTAKFGKYKGREMFVGSLARLYHFKAGSSDKISQFIKKINFKNPFHNNIAQAVEIWQFLEMAIDLSEKLLSGKMDPEIASPQNPTLKGIGAFEAPRGGLYHEIHLDKDDVIQYANIITPTVQNLTSIEKSAQVLLKNTEGQTKKERERLLNMLVRAYDPCITCSVH